MKHTIDNETLNKAIYTVITTKYKKDAQEAHRLVESEGYEIYKNDGQFVVRNNETHKNISGRIDIRHVGFITSYCFTSFHHVRIFVDKRDRLHTKKMNLVSYLDTPFNKAWHNTIDYHTTDNYLYRGFGCPARKKFDEFISKRADSTYYARRIESIKAQIATLTEEMENYIRKDIEAKQAYEDYRKEIGLAG